MQRRPCTSPCLRIVLAHSPLRRCHQLAQALQALRPGLASAADSRLLEMDFGEWEGQPWDALTAAIDAWAADLAGRAEPGRVSAMLRRVDEALQRARMYQDDGAGRDIVWITHAAWRCVQWLMREGNARLRRPSGRCRS